MGASTTAEDKIAVTGFGFWASVFVDEIEEDFFLRNVFFFRKVEDEENCKGEVAKAATEEGVEEVDSAVSVSGSSKSMASADLVDLVRLRE
mmetsp:Transcript_2295/g.5294  ORF Transcript_2295/g.5294 Transcript_2295/m.5294 type:complete len:91 (-) Transcript_2295:837-1109(-)